jgi:site-specific recombinase XerD
MKKPSNVWSSQIGTSSISQIRFMRWRDIDIHAQATHQLRHTCTSMLLNAGMSILGVQRILGHKYVDTTLRYARVYDSTVVKDFQKDSG